MRIFINVVRSANRSKSPGFISDFRYVIFPVFSHVAKVHDSQCFSIYFEITFFHVLGTSQQSLEKPRFYKRFWQVCCLCHCLAYHVLQDRLKSPGFISDLDRWVFHNIVQFLQSPEKPRFYERFWTYVRIASCAFSKTYEKAQVL